MNKASPSKPQDILANRKISAKASANLASSWTHSTYKTLIPRPEIQTDLERFINRKIIACLILGFLISLGTKCYRPIGDPFGITFIALGLAIGFFSSSLMDGIKNAASFILGSIFFFPVLILERLILGSNPMLREAYLNVFFAGAQVATVVCISWIVMIPLGYSIRYISVRFNLTSLK